MERENGKGLLFGVLGVMTLVIAILGASLAYFSTTQRSAEDAVIVEAATVSITYSQGTNLSATDLIPSTLSVAQKAYGKQLSYKVGEETKTEQCKDTNGRTVCSVFRFNIENQAAQATTIEGKIHTSLSEFQNLRYIVYAGTEVDGQGELTNGEVVAGTNVSGDEPGYLFAATGNNTNLLPQEVEIGAKNSGTEKKYFEVLIWLNEEPDDPLTVDIDEGDQNDEQGAQYKGTVEVNVSGQSGEITGSDTPAE